MSASGYVYVVETESGKVKIGVSKNPKKRISALQTSTFERLKNVHISNKCFNFMEIEENLHYIFKNERLNGEWFDLQFEDAVNKLNEQNIITDKKQCDKELVGYALRITHESWSDVKKVSKQIGIAANSYMILAINDYVKNR